MNGSSIFKKVFPVVLAILLIVVISAIATSVKSGSKHTPQILNPDGAYITVKEEINGKEYTYEISNQTMYEELKSGIGLSTIITKANKEVLADEMAKITDEEILEEINNAKYGEGVKEEDVENKEEKEKEFLDTMLQGYGYQTEEEIKDHYRLVLAKEKYAESKLKEEAGKLTEDDKDHELYISTDDIDDYYSDNYNKSYYTLIVPFSSSEQVSNTLLQLGVTSESGKWYEAKLVEKPEGSGIYDVEKGEELTPQQIVKTIIKLFDVVYGYKADYKFEVGTATLNENVYVVEDGKDYALVSCKEDIDAIKTLIEEVKPLVSGEINKEEVNKKIASITSKLNAIKEKLLFDNEVKKLETIVEELKKSIEPSEGDEDNQDPTLVIEKLIKQAEAFDYESVVFNTENKNSKLYYDFTELKEFDSNLPSELRNNFVEFVPYKQGETEASATSGKWYSSSYVTSGNMYYIVLKIKEVEAAKLDDVRAEIKDKLLEEKLTSSYIEKKVAQLRAENGFKVYDTELEEAYIKNISSYDIEYKKTKKENNSNKVCEYKGKEVSADELFKDMDKTSGVATAISELAYVRMMNNTLFNEYYDAENKTWSDEKGKEKRAEIIESLENQRLYFLSGSFSQYGYDPNSMSWQEFLTNVNGVKDEKELAFMNLYSEVSADFMEKALKAFTTKGEGKDLDFEASYKDALTSKAWELIVKKMDEALKEEFSVTGVHLLVSVYDTVNDYVKSKNATGEETGPSALDPKDWTDKQKDLAKELINDVTKYLEVSEGTYEQKLQKLVTAYENAPYAVEKDGKYVQVINKTTHEEVKYYLTCGDVTIDLAKYKSEGLTLTYQNLSTFTNGQMVEAFNNAAKEIFDKDNADQDFSRVTVYENAIETQFGYHLYVNLNSNDFTKYNSIEVDANGEVVKENDEVKTAEKVLPSLYEVRLSVLIPLLEAVDTTELSEEEKEAFDTKVKELKELYTEEIKKAVEKYATPILTDINGTYFSSVVQQAEIKALLANAQINSVSGITKAMFETIIDINKESMYKSNITKLEANDELIVKANEVFGN